MSCNQSLDFQYSYTYDDWNRISEVFIDYINTGINGYKIAEYEYDDEIGVVKKRTYFDSGDTEDESATCTAIKIDESVYSYDQRERLTSIQSQLFDWMLYYDGQAVAGGSQNWNGNINGSLGTYKFLNNPKVPDQPEIFDSPVNYGYKYDNLNRLTEADAAVSILSGPALGFYTGDYTSLGDVRVEYDEIGNIQTLRRGMVAHDPSGQGGQFGMMNMEYNYQVGNNRLLSIQVSGVVPENCHDDDLLYSYSHDANGNQTADSRRGISGMQYGRANLPWSLSITQDDCPSGTNQSVTYLYDANDARIFKKTQNGEEFYLRDASGRELAVFNRSLNTLTWYVYGNERIAKIDHQPEIDLDHCQRALPECTSAMATAQQTSLSGIVWQTDPEALLYPSRLFRIVLCDGSERYVLADEISQIYGNFQIVQQLNLTHFDQDFTVRIGTDVITYTNLAGVLSLRLSDDIVIGDYDPCEEMDCPSEMQACGQSMTREQITQLDSLSALVENLLNSNIPLPATLLRIRICDGREIYVLPAWLQYFTGFYYTILDQVEVTDYNQSFPVTYSNGVQDTVTFNNLSLSLFLVGDEISINDYSPCLDDLPCDEEPVSCPVRSLATLQDDWIQLNLLGTGGYFETAPSLAIKCSRSLVPGSFL
jgi:hypothetical protein